MSRTLDRLPPALLALLDGRDLERKVGETLLLLTVGEDGFPHTALLSVGEVYAPSVDEVRLALWRTSATTANLARTGKATLVAFVPPAAYYLELEARSSGDVVVGESRFAGFTTHPRAILEDVVGYATLESGLTFTLPKPDKVLARWREQVAALRK